MKILHGMSDVAGQATYSVDGLRKNGEDADLVFWRKNGMGYPEIGRDMRIGEKKILYPYYAWKMLAFSVPAAFRYDVYHFHFGHSLIPWALDLFWLKRMHKKTFMEFHGDDIRYFYHKTRPKYFYADVIKEPDKFRLIKNNRILKQIGACITHDEELRKHIPAKRLYITPLRIDIHRFEARYPEPDKRKPVIVHAPSDYVTKGSQYITEAMERLRKRYEFEFILVMM